MMKSAAAHNDCGNNSSRSCSITEPDEDAASGTVGIADDCNRAKNLEIPIMDQDRDDQRRWYENVKGWQKSPQYIACIKRTLQEMIFPSVKILSDHEDQFLAPDFVGNDTSCQSRFIAEVLFRELKLLRRTFDYKVIFWITYRSFVKRQIVKYQNSCVEEMKAAYFKARSIVSSPITMNEIDASRHDGCQELMDILANRQEGNPPDIIRLRGVNGNKLAFFYFAREFLPCITKEDVFIQNKFEFPLSDFVTVADEAFALLILESNVAKWNSMYNDIVSSADQKVPSTTTQTDQDQSTNCCYGEDLISCMQIQYYGYKALPRYNEYYDSIERARRDITRTFVMEQELLDKMLTEQEMMKKTQAIDRRKETEKTKKRPRDVSREKISKGKYTVSGRFLRRERK